MRVAAVIDDIDRYYTDRATDTRLEGRYSPTNAGHAYLLHRRETAVIHALQKQGKFPLRGKRILDIGCGVGWQLRRFVDLGADPTDCFGIDINASRLAAGHYYNAHMTLIEGSAESVPLPDHSFDIVTQFTAFSSMPSPEMRWAAAGEMCRLVKDDGIILWYDFRVRRPGNRYVIPMGATDIRSLFPSCSVHLSSHTLAPPIGRLLAPRSEIACMLLEKIPYLRTHYLGVISLKRR